MSSFTKFLVVLLTVSTAFLCGGVITYVGSATNWKSEYKSLDDEVDALKSLSKSEIAAAKKQMAEAEALLDQLREENTSLKAQLSQVEIDKASLARDNVVNTQRVADSTGIIEGLRQSLEGSRTSLEATRLDLANKTNELASMTKKLNELNTALDEKIVEIDSLEVENKKLLEIKSDLEKMATLGSAAKAPKAVSRMQEKVTLVPAKPATMYGSVDIKALISEVDLRNNLATLTVGSADGVSEGMRFHVTRGNQFICDIVVTHVDQDRAAGVLELIQVAPKVGDNVSTNL